MKTFKFRIKEFGLTGTTDRIIEVRARTVQSAEKKVRRVQGNREWLVTPVSMMIGGF